MTVSASIVVTFGDTSEAAMLVAELDDTINDNKTSFLTTETAYFAIYKYPANLTVNTPIPTAGMVKQSQTVSRTQIEVLRFVNTKSIELSYPPDGAVTVSRWYGNVGSDFSISGFTASISSDEPCICEVTYLTTGDLWRLFPPAIDTDETPEYPIVVHITAEDES